MPLQAIPVKVERGVVRTVDGSPLPEQANALLVIMPAEPEGEDLAAWQRPFDAFFEIVNQHPPSKVLEQVSDAELNKVVHTARPK
jgi:hypothetical protein